MICPFCRHDDFTHQSIPAPVEDGAQIRTVAVNAPSLALASPPQDQLYLNIIKRSMEQPNPSAAKRSWPVFARPAGVAQ
jgi:hypothetical protein